MRNFRFVILTDLSRVMLCTLCCWTCLEKYNAGTPAPSNVCGQTIRTRPSGILLSPTYPGMYPDKIFCFYKINGEPGQRIKLTFLDIDLYSGGDQYAMKLYFLSSYIYIYIYIYIYVCVCVCVCECVCVCVFYVC